MNIFPLIDKMISDDSPNSNENPPVVDDENSKNKANERNDMRDNFRRDPKQKYSLGTWEIPMGKLRKTAPNGSHCIEGKTNLNS